MKILHTSDWHIGKKLYGKDRLNEQRNALYEIADICADQNVDMVCVAGDIFDVYTPSSEAEDIFYDGILKISGNNERLVIIIAGNHDDPVRLSAAESLAVKQGIIIVKGFDYKAKLSNSGKVKIVKSINGGLVAENPKEDRCAIAYLPYPSDARFNEIINPNEAYSDKVFRWLNSGVSLFSKNTYNIIMSHIFTDGAKVCGDERNIELGGAKIVALSAFNEACDYIMLGHIHKCQSLSKSRKIEYCGAIMQNTFDENDSKGVKILTVTNNKLDKEEFIALKTPKKLKRIFAESVLGAVEKLDKEKDCFIELTLKLGSPLTYLDNKMLRTTYPDITNIILDFKTEKQKNTPGVKHLNKEDLFIAFWKSRFNKAPDNNILKLYLELMEGDLSDETVLSGS